MNTSAKQNKQGTHSPETLNGNGSSLICKSCQFCPSSTAATSYYVTPEVHNDDHDERKNFCYACKGQQKGQAVVARPQTAKAHHRADFNNHA
eukprot:scaffold306331_cov20-Prasinocladus_malaysianus.AAC.1